MKWKNQRLCSASHPMNSCPHRAPFKKARGRHPQNDPWNGVILGTFIDRWPFRTWCSGRRAGAWFRAACSRASSWRTVPASSAGPSAFDRALGSASSRRSTAQPPATVVYVRPGDFADFLLEVRTGRDLGMPPPMCTSSSPFPLQRRGQRRLHKHTYRRLGHRRRPRLARPVSEKTFRALLRVNRGGTHGFPPISPIRQTSPSV